MKVFTRYGGLVVLILVALVAVVIALHGGEWAPLLVAMAYIQPNAIKIRVPVSSLNPSGVQSKSLDEVAKEPMGVFTAYMDNIIGARMQVFYDAFILISGTNLPEGAVTETFKNGLGEIQNIWNTGVGIKQRKHHTNMVANGSFEYGVSVIVVAIECLYVAPPALATTYAADGLVQNAADAAVQPVGYNPAQFARSLMLQTSYLFRRGSDVTEENGLLIDLPSNAGLAGQFGAQANANLVQNSLGPNSARLLEYPKILHSSENFQIDLTALGVLPIPVTTMGHIRLIGKRLRSS